MAVNGMDLASLGIQGLGGLFSGLSGAKQGQQSQKQQAQSRLDGILNQLMQFQQGKLDRSRQDAQNFQSAQGPLGQEQSFVQKNNIMRALLPGLANTTANRPTDPAINAAMGQTTNPLAALMQNGALRPDIASTFSDDAVARSLAEKRKGLAMLNPDYQFGSMGDFGLGNANPFDAEVSQQGKLVKDQQNAGYGDIQSILNNQWSDAQKSLTDMNDKKDPGFWHKLGGALLPIAGVAANFIPGVGPLAGMALSTLGGAAGGALNGGVKGAILGGAGGAAAGYGVNQLPGQKAPQGPQFNNKMTAASLPTSMQGAAVQGPGAGQLQLPAQFNGGMQGLPQMVSQNKPNIPAPQPVKNKVPNIVAPPRPPVPSGPVNLNSIPPEVGMQQIFPRQTTSDPFTAAKVGGGPIHIDNQALSNYGRTAAPAMLPAGVGAGVGAAGALGAFGAGPLAAAGAMGAEAAMDPRAQQIISNLMNLLNEGRGATPGQKVVNAQAIVQAMQPYLQKVPGTFK